MAALMHRGSIAPPRRASPETCDAASVITKAGWLIVWIALAACGGAGKSSPQPAPTPVERSMGDASCKQAVDRLFAVTAAQERADLRDVSAKVFVHRCETDGWSAEIKQCMSGVKAPPDADTCEAMLTPEQSRELRDELARELDAAGVKPEVQSGKPSPKAKEPAAPEKKKRASDPCEGGE